MTPIVGIIASSVQKSNGAFESIATVGGSLASSFTFSSIPSTYKYLQIRFIAKESSTGSANRATFNIRFNGDTAANYTTYSAAAIGSPTYTENTAATSITPYYGLPNSFSTINANSGGSGIIDITNYSSTSQHKTVKIFNGNAASVSTGDIIVTGGFWSSTSAITSITITSTTNNFTAISSFALYGIKG